MAYSELVKNFNKIRDYMREFYVYGFKSRDEYTKKSARSYDDERRRMESWLGDYMRFRQTPDGKNVFISIDSRVSRHNPLYKAWKTKSFTDGDITLHFVLFDILSSPDVSLSLNEITDKIDDYLCDFAEPKVFDESTVRKKLKEYVAEGLILSEKQGKTVTYRRVEDVQMCDLDVLDFFSEVLPCGVIGSFLLDKTDSCNDHFAFKHHYITGAMDSEILCSLFIAMREKRHITLETINRHKDRISENHVIPLRITTLNSQLQAAANTSEAKKEQQSAIFNLIVSKMNEAYKSIDPNGNLLFADIFTKRDEVFSGSEETVFHIVKLYALRSVLGHNYPIVIDSFRAEDLSTQKESLALNLFKEFDNQVILTTTLKKEEMGKYDTMPGINHIDYKSHQPSKMLSEVYSSNFVDLLQSLSLSV